MKYAIALLILAASSAIAQTAVSIGSIRCPGQGAALAVPIGIPAGIFGVPVMTFACVQLDPAGFTLDKSTTPWTLRTNTVTATVSTKPVRETLTGTLDGVNATFTLSSTPATGYPVLIYRNGLLQASCVLPATGGCNADYQISGQSIAFLTAAQTASGIAAVPGVTDVLTGVYWK